jgi:hypothetical protein
MMDAKQRVSPFLKRWRPAIVLLATLLCCGSASYLFIPHFKLAVNRLLWKLSEPPEYYMQVHAFTSYGCSWRWAVRVRDSQAVSIDLLKEDRDGPCESLIDLDNPTIDEVFRVLGKGCAARGFLDCGLEFDPRFHYPRYSESYEYFIIQVEQFVPCGEEPADCP